MPKAPTTTIKQAIAEHRDGNFAACESTCRKLLAANLNDADARHIFGLVKYTTKHLSQALVEIEHALSLPPDNPLYHADFATVLNDIGELERAEHRYQSPLKTDPRNLAALNGLGIIARKQLKYNLAIEYYRRAIDIDASFATAHNNPANVLALIGRFGSALSHSDKALIIQPDNAD